MDIKKEHFAVMPCNDPTCHGVMQYLENRYWCCLDGDPARALFWKGRSPQCNANKQIAERLKPKCFDNVEVVFVPNGYAPIDLSDYSDT